MPESHATMPAPQAETDEAIAAELGALLAETDTADPAGAPSPDTEVDAGLDKVEADLAELDHLLKETAPEVSAEANPDSPEAVVEANAPPPPTAESTPSPPAEEVAAPSDAPAPTAGLPTSAPAEDESPAAPQTNPSHWTIRGPRAGGHVALWLLVQLLTVLDLPFAGFSSSLKSMIGYVAIATLVMALANWMLAGLVLTLVQ